MFKLISLADLEIDEKDRTDRGEGGVDIDELLESGVLVNEEGVDNDDEESDKVLSESADKIKLSFLDNSESSSSLELLLLFNFLAIKLKLKPLEYRRTALGWFPLSSILLLLLPLLPNHFVHFFLIALPKFSSAVIEFELVRRRCCASNVSEGEGVIALLAPTDARLLLTFLADFLTVSSLVLVDDTTPPIGYIQVASSLSGNNSPEVGYEYAMSSNTS
jgi:hypothetical protein